MSVTGQTKSKHCDNHRTDREQAMRASPDKPRASNARVTGKTDSKHRKHHRTYREQAMSASSIAGQTESKRCERHRKDRQQTSECHQRDQEQAMRVSLDRPRASITSKQYERQQTDREQAMRASPNRPRASNVSVISQTMSNQCECHRTDQEQAL